MDSTPDSPIEGYRLSPQQRNLWSLQPETEGQRFRAFSAIRIEGNLDASLLQQAVAELGARHEILRTVFTRPPGIKIPFQVINDVPQFSWSVVDLSTLHVTEQEVRIAEQVAQINGKHFDFAHGPLLSLCLIKCAAGSQILLLSLPALCSDSMTLANFTAELCRACGNEDLSTEPMQYADFAEWQHELLEAEDADAMAGKNHWRNLQAAAVPTLALPCERRAIQPHLFEPASLATDLSSSLSRLEAFAREQESSVSAVLFACWQALVWRLSGERESQFTLYWHTTGRKSEDLVDALGLYAKSLPICSYCDDESFTTHLYRVSNGLKEADRWQEYFDPAASRNTRTSVAYDFEDRPVSFKAGSVTFTVIDQHACFSPFKLKLSCVRSGTTLSASLHYDKQVFDEETVKRFAGYFERFLAGVLDNPHSHPGEIDIMEAAEYARLFQLKQTTSAWLATETVHELFEVQVSRTPGALAVVCGDQQLTYDELNSRANQVAHLLRRYGVGPDVRVGLCVERSVDTAVGMLGILKAGGAYVPLNPDHPHERLTTQLADSNSSVLITSGAINGTLAFAGKTIDLERDPALLESESKYNLASITAPENLVYVIYTSGSTGTPKGVAVRHENLINYTRFILERLEVNAPLTFATVSTMSADLGNTCIFPALLSGGCLHVIGYETSMEGDLLRNYFSKHRIDVLKIVPSHLSALLATQSEGGILPRKYLLLGGEALTWDLVQSISRLPRTCRIVNHYGPTETTVGSLTFAADEDGMSLYSATVPIGRPVTGSTCYILDRRLRPAPFGVSGELYIGGAGVASGYINQPAETAARFIPDPFSSAADARLYRTGDLARYLPGDVIEFLGRADHQVKIRGYRVELPEIEAVLATLTGVSQAVVTLNGDLAGQERIVAYLVSPQTSQDVLRAAVKQKLPDYMVPSVFVFLKSLPLTPNGKVDRAALPAPDDSRLALQADFVAPRSAVEKELAGLWARLLKTDAVGVHDNFFALGGHSLLATQLISRVRKEFRVELPLRSLFEAPTVAALAEKVENATADDTARLLAELDQISDEEAVRMLGLKKG